MRKKILNILIVCLFLVGLSFLLYPTISDYYNSRHQSQAIASYSEKADSLSNAKKNLMIQEAKEYNQRLILKSDRFYMTKEEKKEYESLLDVSGTGMMGYVEIPVLNLKLPIYHGTDEDTLQVAIGHLAGTSFPVGGKGVHTVISGHRGLPSAKLFTNLDMMQEGDIFMLHILNKTYMYKVDQIRIVLPSELNDLDIDVNKDLCTLVTCTPYGINSHRLLVRGHRIKNIQAFDVSSELVQIDPYVVACILAVPFVILLFVLIRRIY